MRDISLYERKQEGWIHEAIELRKWINSHPVKHTCHIEMQMFSGNFDEDVVLI